MLLQLYVLYYGLADVIALGPWSAAIIGLGLNYAAYEAEIYRGAIQADPGARSGRRPKRSACRGARRSAT